MLKARGVLIALAVLFGCHISQGQSQVTTGETELVRQAVQSYLETTAQNLDSRNPVPSNVVHPQMKIFSKVGEQLLISSASRKSVKKTGEIKLESTERITLVDVTGSMAVAKVEIVYPYGSLTAAEYNSLPENDPLRSSAGKPIKMATYLSLLKLDGDWKIVSLLIATDVKGDK